MLIIVKWWLQYLDIHLFILTGKTKTQNMIDVCTEL